MTLVSVRSRAFLSLLPGPLAIIEVQQGQCTDSRDGVNKRCPSFAQQAWPPRSRIPLASKSQEHSKLADERGSVTLRADTSTSKGVYCHASHRKPLTGGGCCSNARQTGATCDAAWRTSKNVSEICQYCSHHVSEGGKTSRECRSARRSGRWMYTTWFNLNIQSTRQTPEPGLKTWCSK
jgi:hypothetical protein